jgi:hypothetical protein
MWLLKKLTPDHKTIADFRKNNADSIRTACRWGTLNNALLKDFDHLSV